MTFEQIFNRLGTGKRWWAAELVIRALGLALAAVAFMAGHWLYGSVHTPPPHEASVLELLAAAAIVVGACGGGILTLLGPSIFARVPVPQGGSLLSLTMPRGRQ